MTGHELQTMVISTDNCHCSVQVLVVFWVEGRGGRPDSDRTDVADDGRHSTSNCHCCVQDFVWGFALVLTGLTLQAVVIRYGVTTFRATVVNDFGIDDWKLPKVWEYAIKYVIGVTTE